MKVKAEAFIDLEASDAFKAADALVKRHSKMLTTLKDRMKRDGVKTISIRRGQTMKRLTFTIRKMNKVDTKLLPDELRDTYTRETEVWIKNTDIVDMDIVDSDKVESDLGDFSGED